MQTIEHTGAPLRPHHLAAGARRLGAAKPVSDRPLPGEGMKTGTSLSPEDIRRIVADMVG
ncbi:hypothetical protein [Caenispirillum bisanense]|uniref:hypothetical protein n=1 Tax=Caenispirillum bisanense TaxID=414052 RepID=UPI0031D21DAD